MSDMTAEQMLDLIAENKALRDSLLANKVAEIRQIIPVEIQERIDSIEVAVSDSVAAIDNLISDLENQVRELTIEKGATVKGRYLMAVWNKGRAGGWDNGKLEGFAMAYPAILAAKKPDGEPTVSIRAVGK